MSAIVGIYCLDNRPVERQGLEKMAEGVAHRGPDDGGLWNEGSVGLGQRMLWTTPESLKEKLPLVNRSGDLVLTADARIDNREELIAAVALTDRRPGELSDSQLILAAYEKWGEGCPEKLVGDFAFAIWDRRKQAFFCARDVMGIRPFYYHRTRRVFAFASEIKALLCLPEVPRQLNEVKVAYYLARILEDRVITFYQDIFRLPAAHRMTVSREGIRIEPYWTVNLSHELRFSSDTEYAEAFRQIFTEVVRCRLRRVASQHRGVLLSGGLDSSSIACTARHLLAEAGEGRLHAFSAIFPDLPEEDQRLIDERPYLQAVLAQGGFDPHYVEASLLSPLADVERVLWHADEPFFGPNLYIHWALHRAAHQQKVRVLLDGIDGDSTVSHGYEYLTELVRTGKWKTLIQEATALSRNLPVPATITPRRIIWECGFKPLVPTTAVQVWRRWRGRRQPVWGKHTAIHPAFARRIHLAERVKNWVNRKAPGRTAREIHWNNLTAAPIQYALELADKAAAAFSLEPRYPFCDRRLMEFCLALPPDQKLHQGWNRAVMRRAMDGILPPEVQWRTSKAILSPNFRRRLLDYERETLEAVVKNPPPVIQEYVDVSVLNRAYQRYASQPMQREQDAFTVFTAVVLALWLQQASFTP